MSNAKFNSNRTRSFATLVALWAVVITGLIVSGVQVAAFRQAASGREAVARIRAYWAARAGVEEQIAQITFNTLTPDPNSAFTIIDDARAAAVGEVGRASWSISHWTPTDVSDGPEDAHSKININTMTRDDLMFLRYMDESMADAILDWIDEDDEPNEFGAELGQYLSLKSPYMPRNGPIRSLKELELVYGVRPEYVREEDWNLNGILDPNEDDGDLSFPPDNADGKLDAGWSAIITASSEDAPGLAASGEARLDLATASAEDIAQRVGVDRDQADAIANHAASGGVMSDFVRTDLPSLATGSGATLLSGAAPRIAALTRDQLAALLDEGWIDDGAVRAPRSGKLNINTCDKETITYLASIDPGIADSIILERDASAGGFVSLVDLLNVPSVTSEVLADLMDLIDVRSNVYRVVCRGRDEATGFEVEIAATLDRSTIPVVIRDLSVR